jgi:hypothetical protein
MATQSVIKNPYDQDTFQRILYQTLTPYEAEKMGDLLYARYSDAFEPSGFILWLELVEIDVREGLDTPTGKRIQGSCVHVFDSYIVELAYCLRGETFSLQVKQCLAKMDALMASNNENNYIDRRDRALECVAIKTD